MRMRRGPELAAISIKFYRKTAPSISIRSLQPTSQCQEAGVSVKGDLERVLKVELFGCMRAIANRNLTEATERLSVAIHELERLRPQIGRMEITSRNAKRLYR
jgi:hypothetical protein